MNDLFKEQLVRKRQTMKDIAIRALLSVCVGLIFLIGAYYLKSLTIIITALAGYIAYMLSGRLNIEYEYTYTDGDLDIDIIYNKSSRKKLFTGEVKNFEIMAHVMDADRARTLDSAQETRNYTSGVLTDHTYAFITNIDGKRVKIIFEPNDELIKSMSSVLTTRRFFEKK